MHKLSIGVFWATAMITCHLLAGNPKGEKEEISPSVYLPAGKVIFSPNGKLKCFTENLDLGQNLYLQRDGEKKLLHYTGRNLGVTWAPNSKWLAVMDNDAAGENYIVVFDVTQKTPVAVAKTPESPGEVWTIQGWNIAKKELNVQSGGQRGWKIAPHSLSLNLE